MLINNNGFEPLDITIFLRAFSIFAIVSGHFGLVGLSGGAFYLIFLSGYNFVKFTLPKINGKDGEKVDYKASHFYNIYSNFLIKLVTPVLLYTTAIYILLDRYYFAGFFLTSNFYGPDYGEGLTFWFIEVLVQIYFLFYLLTLTNKYYNWLVKAPFVSFLTLFVSWFLISLICRSYWDTSAWLDRFPHLMIYIFFLGALIASSRTSKQKIISFVCVLSVCLEFYLFGSSSRTNFLILGALLTMFIPPIPVPSIIYKPIYTIAISSLFIYLCHFQARSLLEKIPLQWDPIFTVTFALLVGVIMAKVWKNKEKIFAYLSPSAKTVK